MDGRELLKLGAASVDASSVAETAFSSLGIHHSWWRGVPFDPALPYLKQLDALRPRVDALENLFAKYRFKACLHPGGEFNQGTLANQIREGGAYIGGFVFKDFVVDHPAPEQQAAAAAARDAGRGAGPGDPGGGSPNGWSSRQVQVGTGVLNLPLICRALKDINFSGPIECQPEWPELGGPNLGLDELSIPRADVIRMLKLDFPTVSGPLAAAGAI